MLIIVISSCAYLHKIIELSENSSTYEFRFSQFYIPNYPNSEDNPPSKTAHRLLSDPKYKKYYPDGFRLVQWNGESRVYASYTVTCK